MAASTFDDDPTDPPIDGPDRLAELMRQWASGVLDALAMQELSAAVHQQIHPVCVAVLGGAEAAYDAEQETWLRLLEHLKRRDPGGIDILDGAAYVRQVARNVCHDLGRGISQLRRQVAVDDVGEEHLATAPAWTDITAPPTGSPLRRGVPAQFGYRSKRLLEDLDGLSGQERNVLMMRQQGWSYTQIAERLGGGLTQGTAQTQGDRAMHHLRGRAHVIVWLQDDLRRWPAPRCPDLAAMKAAVHERVAGGKAPTTTLYRDIGKHLDPHPNRRGGSLEEASCRICLAERKRSELTYWWLIVTLPPLLALPSVPVPEPTALHDSVPAQDQPAPRDRQRRRRPRNRARTVTLAGIGLAVALVVAALAVVVPPLVRRGNPEAARPPAVPGGTGAAASGRASIALPDPCRLVTQDDVAGTTGHTVGACAGQQVSGASGAMFPIDGSLGVYIWSDPSVGPIGVSSMVQVYAYDLGADAATEFPTGCARFAADQKLQAGTVAGLGDDNCRMTNAEGSVEVILIRRANIAIGLFVLMYDLKPDTATRLATIALSHVG
jgi:RNA polymerase sigma factor (sigma-70 family)